MPSLRKIRPLALFSETPIRCLCVLLLWQMLPATCLSQDRSMIEACKAAVALVEVDSDKVATAFCIDPYGIFVTNYHVVDEVEKDGFVRLVMRSSESDEWTLSASVLATDKKNDLAIIKADSIPEGKKLVAIELAQNPSLYETMNLTAYGFPFGKQLTVKEGANPSISVNVGKLTAIRKENGIVELIQLDATLNPGNSGGPVVDESGKVVGVVSFGLLTSGVNFAIPSDKIWPLLKTPLIEVQAPELGLNPESPVTVVAKLIMMQSILKDPLLELLVRVGELPEQRYELRPSGQNQYQAHVVVAQEEASKLSLRARAVFEQGEASFRLNNERWMLGGKEHWWSSVSSIRLLDDENAFSVLMRSGEELRVEPEKLPAIQVDYGNLPATLPLSKAKYLEIVREKTPKITARLEVKSEGKILFIHTLDTNETIEVEAASATLANRSSSGPVDSLKNAVEILETKERETKVKEAKTLRIPGVITNTARAGAGRYLLVSCASSLQLFIVEVDRAVVVKTLKMPSSTTLVSGTQNHFFLLDPLMSRLTRFSLETCEPDLAVAVPINVSIKSMASGEASDGPLLLSGVTTESKNKKGIWTFLDTQRLKVIPVNQPNITAISESTMIIRASANGKVFGAWEPFVSPSGIYIGTLIDRNLTFQSSRDVADHVLPNADGSYILTGRCGILNATNAYEVKDKTNQGAFFATSHPQFYLTFPRIDDSPYSPIVLRGVSVHQFGAQYPLARLPFTSTDFPDSDVFRKANELTLDQRLYFDLESNLLVAIPKTNDRIHIQPFDLIAAIKKTSSDYFFAYAPKITRFVPGQIYTSRVRVETNRRDLKYDLLVGPSGLAVDDTGKITWNVPSGYRPRSVDVIISVTSDGIHQGFASFSLESTKGE